MKTRLSSGSRSTRRPVIRPPTALTSHPRLLAWVARTFGPSSVLPLILAEEGREVQAYLGLARTSSHQQMHQAAIDIAMLNLVDEAISDVATLVKPGGRIGLLATEATLSSGLYTDRRSRTNQLDLDWILPTADDMSVRVMPCIAAVKAGDLATADELVRGAAKALQSRGAQALLLGCTEIPLVLDQRAVEIPMIDATAALARAAVRWSLARPIEARAGA